MVAYVAVVLTSTVTWLLLSAWMADRTGLRRQVWVANDFPGAPVTSDISPRVTLDFLDDDPRLPREFFSARWRGYWYLPDGQSITVQVQADDYLDLWIDGTRHFTGSSAAARTIVLDPGLHELRIDYQQHAGAAHLRLYEGFGDVYPRPLRTGYLFPNQPEPSILQLAKTVDRLQVAVGILWTVGAVAAVIFFLRRRRTGNLLDDDLAASALNRRDVAVLAVLCAAMLVYGYGNLWPRLSTEDGLYNLAVGIRLAQDGVYQRSPAQDGYQREPLGPSLIALTDLVAEPFGLGVPLECVSDGGVTRSEPCRMRYAPYRAVNLVVLLAGALGVFWLVLRVTGRRLLAYPGFLMAGQNATLLASADSFYTEIHAATLMVAVAALSWVTITTRRLGYAALLGLALSALVLTKVVFVYLWIPIALTLAMGDLLRRRIGWTTAGLVGALLVAQGIPVVGWMARNYLAAEDFSIVAAWRSADVLNQRVFLNGMRHDEWVAGFSYYLPQELADRSLTGVPRESFERFEGQRPDGFRQVALASFGNRLDELGRDENPAVAGLDELDRLRWLNDLVARETRRRLLADPVRHLKVSLLLAWRGVFVEEGLGFLTDPILNQRFADIRGLAGWPRWRWTYGATAATLVSLIGFLALGVVPLWFWLGRGRLDVVLIFLPALYSHGAYAVSSHFLPRYAAPEILLRVTATMLLLFLVWSSLQRIVRPALVRARHANSRMIRRAAPAPPGATTRPDTAAQSSPSRAGGFGARRSGVRDTPWRRRHGRRALAGR